MDFQSSLVSHADASLSSLMWLDKKEKGIAKLRGDDEYIPNSCGFDPPLEYPRGLKDDEETQEEEDNWRDILMDCKRALATCCLQQGERNLHFWRISPRPCIFFNTSAVVLY